VAEEAHGSAASRIALWERGSHERGERKAPGIRPPAEPAVPAPAESCQTVKLRFLGHDKFEASEAVASDWTGQEMSLWYGAAVPAGEALLVEADDDMLLAEVRDCEQHGGHYRLMLAVRCLTTRRELERLIRMD
jgi:hypothetical protein